MGNKQPLTLRTPFRMVRFTTTIDGDALHAMRRMARSHRMSLAEMTSYALWFAIKHWADFVEFIAECIRANHKNLVLDEEE